MRARALKVAPALLVPLAVAWVADAHGLALAPVVAAATAAVTIGLATLALGRGVRRDPALAWLGGLVAWVALAAAIRPVAAAPAAWTVAIGVTAIALALAADSPRGAAWATAAVVAAGTLAAAWLVVEAWAVHGRPAGPLENPNLAATIVVFGLLTLPALRLGRAVRGVLVGLHLAGVLASGSRGALLALAAACGTWALRETTPRLRRLALGGGAAALAGLAMVLLLGREPLRWEKARLWEVAGRTAMAELPLGSGPGGYADAARPHNFPREGEFARYHRIPALAENDALQLAATLGLPGLLLAGGLAWRAGAGLWRAGSRGAAIAAAIAAGSAVNTQLAAPVVAWTAVLAIAAARSRPTRGRLRAPAGPGVAGALALLVAVPTGVALTWPAPGLGEDPDATLARAAAAARQAGGDEGVLADAAAGAWRAAWLRPRSAQAWRLVGSIALERATRRRESALADEAVAAFRRAREVNPHDVWAALGEGQAERLLGDGHAAKAAFGAALAIEPSCVPCWLEAATLAVEDGDLFGARTALARAEVARRAGVRATFVSAYERRLAAADPVLLARLRRTLGGSER